MRNPRIKRHDVPRFEKKVFTSQQIKKANLQAFLRCGVLAAKGLDLPAEPLQHARRRDPGTIGGRGARVRTIWGTANLRLQHTQYPPLRQIIRPTPPGLK